jgi:calcium-dependent protein kinase
MPRVDIWDVAKLSTENIDCGFLRHFAERYAWDRELGQGGFGVVRVVKRIDIGKEFACKSIAKKLDIPNVSPSKQNQHLENIKREVAILRKLKGTLNVVFLEDVCEDDTHVHIIMELCRGGELVHHIGKKHYSERTVCPVQHCSHAHPWVR